MDQRGILLGGGTDQHIWDVEVYNGDLFVAGGFQKAGGYGYSYGATWDSIMGISRWDGQNWCSLNTVFDNGITNIEFFKDSLYAAGNYWSINGDTSLTKLAKTKVGLLSPCSKHNSYQGGRSFTGFSKDLS